MFPLSAPDTSLERLLGLVADYAPRELALLGDIVHRAVPVAALEDDLRRLSAELGCRVRLRLISGNHDRGLAALLRRCAIEGELLPLLEAGPHRLLHGDQWNAEEAARELELARMRRGRIFMGHEHPAIGLGDGVASIKCPCFLVAPELVVLPAFSDWAAGASVRGGRFLSALAQTAVFQTAHAIVAGKLLPLRP
jgi:metallophosphoesterase superfamily enzyme